MQPANVFLGMQLRPDLRDALRQHATARGVTLSFLVRQILVAWLRAETAAKSGGPTRARVA